MDYTIWQWLLFFYIYSFFGWIWECALVSVREKKFVNRGFLHGPILPIYGVGAVAILICTLAVSDNTFLVFVYGMIGATTLEYFTGAGMEKLFHVKYWDYSNHKFNLNGHICLMASLCWGVFSILMTEVIHIPVNDFAVALGNAKTEIIVFLLTIAAAFDFSKSFEEAMDLREMLEKLSESKNYIHTLQRRLEIASVVTIDEFKKIKNKREEENASRKQKFLDNLNALREMRRKELSEIMEKIETASKQKVIENIEFEQFKNGVLSELQKMGSRRDKEYSKIVSILRRNPKAKSEKFGETLKEILKLMD